MFLEWTYNSNAIEGNTLTLSETKVALDKAHTTGSYEDFKPIIIDSLNESLDFYIKAFHLDF